MDYLDSLACYIADADYDSFDRQTIDHAKKIIIDLIGIIILANQQKNYIGLAELLDGDSNKATSRIFGRDFLLSPSLAALVNGSSAHSLLLDDTHPQAGGHPGSYVIPSVLAVGESIKSSGKDIITSIILGYEVAARLGCATKLRAVMHACGTWSVVGAAVAVSKLIGQTKKKIVETVKLAANLTLATSSSCALEGATAHDLYTGFTGFLGVLVPRFVDCGFTGETQSLEKVFGSISGTAFSSEKLIERFGDSFAINDNFLKIHAVCGLGLPAITAFENIIEENKFIRNEDISLIKVETYKRAVDELSSNRPVNPRSARFSIPYALAARLTFGNLKTEIFLKEHLENPSIRQLCDRIEVVEDPQMTLLFPNNGPSRVTVYMKDGNILSSEVLMNKGTKDYPYSGEELKNKFMHSVVPILGKTKGMRIMEIGSKLERIKDINELTKHLVTKTII